MFIFFPRPRQFYLVDGCSSKFFLARFLRLEFQLFEPDPVLQAGLDEMDGGVLEAVTLSGSASTFNF